MMRIALFLMTNVAIMAMLTVVMSILTNVFGLQLGNYGQLLIMSAVIGFTGSLISLAMSKGMAKRSMGVQFIEQPTTQTEHWLVNTVQRQADQA